MISKKRARIQKQLAEGMPIEHLKMGLFLAHIVAAFIWALIFWGFWTFALEPLWSARPAVSYWAFFFLFWVALIVINRLAWRGVATND